MNESTQKPAISAPFWLICGLIAFAVAVRLLAHFVPSAVPYNFAPVGAIALFGGAWFADRRYAFIVPISAMLISDLLIELHPLLPVVYACMALTTLLGFAMRGRVNAWRVASSGVASAVLFFLVTNLAFWLTQFIYPQLTYPMTAAGLVECYAAAIPFFKNDLIGTLLWSAVLFGGYALLRGRVGMAPHTART
ncbi:MAG: DUF6580 family putative transport protein [Tahibacter sp.]